MSTHLQLLKEGVLKDGKNLFIFILGDPGSAATMSLGGQWLQFTVVPAMMINPTHFTTL